METVTTSPATPVPTAPALVSTLDTSPVPFGRRLVALAVMATALTLGLVGLLLNYRFAMSLAGHETSADALARIGITSGPLLATIAIGFDVLTILLPATAGALWLAGQWRDGLIAWGIYAVALAMTLIAASSFVATNVGDSRLERSDVTQQRGRLDARLADLTARRSAITERRSVGQIDAALQAAQQDYYVLAVWRRTGGCVDVTLTASSSACKPVTELRQAKASAEGRDQLDAQIAAAEADKAKLPAIASADPGAEWLATTLHAGFGLPLTSAIVGNVRIAGLALAPPLSGWLLKFAFVLLGTRRRPLATAAPTVA